MRIVQHVSVSWAGVLIAVVAFAAPARAADVATARLVVRVTASPGATGSAVVTIVPEGSAGRARSSAADVAGPAIVFERIPPGAYHVTASLPGFAIGTTTLGVTAGEDLSITAVLCPIDDQTARSRIDVIWRHTTAYGTEFTRDALRYLPTGGSLWSLLETADALTISDRMDTGGLAAGMPARIGAHGGSWTQTSFRLDDLDVTDLTTGGVPLLYPDLAALEAVDVVHTMIPAEIGPPGPAVTMMTRRPARTWQGSAETALAPAPRDAYATRGSIPAISTLTSWRYTNLLVSGPITDRLGLLLSTTVADSRWLQSSDPGNLTSGLGSVLGHLVFHATDRDEVRVLGIAQRLHRPIATRARLTASSDAERASAIHVQSTFERQLAGTASWSVTAGFQRGGVSREPSPPSLTIERLRDGPVSELASATADAHQRWSLAGSLHSWPVNAWRTHHLVRGGISFDRASTLARPGMTGLIGEQVDGLAARVWDYGRLQPQSRWGETAAGLFAADRMVFGNFLVAEAGIRFDALSGSAAGPADVRWLNLSPRVSARWAVPRVRRLTLLTGAARYQDEYPLRNLAFGDPAAPHASVYRWTDPNGDRLVQPGEVGTLIARVGPGAHDATFASVDPNLKRPHTDEFLVGFEARLGDSWTSRLIAVARRERDLIAAVNVGAPPSSYTTRFLQDPGLNSLDPVDDQLLPVYDRLPSSFGQDRYYLTNPDADRAHYEGVEVSVDKRLTSRLQLLVGASAGRSGGTAASPGFLSLENDTGLSGEQFTNPNADTFASGRLFFERGYTLKVAGTYHHPRELTFSAVGRYQDGQHFARLIIVPDLNQGPEPVRALANGKTRFTFVCTVDARLEKGATLRGHHVAGYIAAFNLINLHNEVEEVVVSGPAFRAVNQVQPPRVVHLGVRVGF